MPIANIIDDRVQAAVASFQLEMVDLGEKAWRRVKSNTEKLPIDTEGKLVSSKESSELMGELGQSMLVSLQSDSFTRAINQMKNELEPMREEVQEFYEDKFGFEAPVEVERLSRGLVTSTSNELDSEIGEAGYETHVINPVISAMAEHITNRSDRDHMVVQMRELVTEKIKDFTQIKSATIMQQFGRRLNDLFGRLGSSKVRYVGPNDEVTREFCQERVGNTYTIEEVQGWAAEDWAGKMPSTDRGSIFVNLGGWNCRHVLEYVK